MKFPRFLHRCFQAQTVHFSKSFWNIFPSFGQSSQLPLPLSLTNTSQSSGVAQALLPQISPAPDVPSGFGKGGMTHNVMVRGEIEGVLVPQQPVVSIVPVALPAICTIVVIIQDLKGVSKRTGGIEEDNMRLKKRGCSQARLPHAGRGKRSMQDLPTVMGPTPAALPAAFQYIEMTSIYRNEISASHLGALQADRRTQHAHTDLLLVTITLS